MTDIPDASNLLATAREVLLADLLPALPKERRHAALMIANAMAIAEREQRQGAEALRQEIARLRELLESTGSPPAAAGVAAPSSPPPVPADPATLRRRLAEAIRSGAFDDPPHNAALVDHLARSSADWTAISNPKALREPR
ncbi:MAG TPA: DUF6285 domain-containing protein [Casimicrobiaceae bacterium]|nr:DUF6285 domain-containing protein [Casimicrobiaceae bacterium]